MPGSTAHSLDLLDIDDPQLLDSIVRPEGDDLIPDADELNVTTHPVLPAVIPDLVWVVGKLQKQPDQPPLPILGKVYQKRAAFDERTGS